jgi:hypothetical protein
MQSILPLAVLHKPQSNHTLYAGGTMDALFSRTIKSGKTTYFVDIKEAKNKNKYITVAESSATGTDGDKKFTRKSIVIFDNSAEQIRDALGEATEFLKKG